MEYLSSVISSMFTILLFTFFIAAAGYLVGGIKVKGISLGTAGVLLVALLFGVLAGFVPEFTVGGKTIALFNSDLKSKYSLISNIGTALFVTSVGLIAGPKFFRTFGKETMKFVYMGIITILLGTVVTVLFILIDKEMGAPMAVGLMTGALTSTPGLSAAKEVAGEASDLVVSGYGIAYIFGVLGVVLFVQIMPKIMHVDIEQERERFIAAGTVEAREIKCKTVKVEPMGFLPLFVTIFLGCILGAIKIPGINFSLGNSGGCLIAGLIVGHFGHIGKIDLRIEKSTLNFFRELGLVLFLVGAGVPSGVNFVSTIKLNYFLYGALMTLVPMVISFIIGQKVFKLDIFNNLGSITGGMTSTPALGSLIATAGTEEVAASYAATYPVALVLVVLVAKIVILIF